MQDESPENNPKNIWLNQPAEPSVMTVEKIRNKARELHAKTRRQLLGYVTAPLAVVFLCGFSVIQFPLLQRVLQPLFVLALVWSLAGLYFLNRGMWLPALPGDAGFSTGLEFCRREIEGRRLLLRRVLLWSFGPVLLAIAAFILALAMVATKERGIFPNALPFLTLVVVWVVGYLFVVRVREQRELRRQIDELDSIERENGR